LQFSFKRFYGVLKYSASNRDAWFPILIACVLIIINALLSFNPLIDFLEKSKREKWQNEIYAFENQTKNNSILDKLYKLDFNLISKDSIEINKHIYFQRYNIQSNQLEFWSNQSIYLSSYQLNEFEKKIVYIKFNNHNYLVKSQKFKDKFFVFWFDIDHYVSENLDNSLSFFERNSERKEYNILGYTTSKSNIFTDIDKDFLFSIERTSYSNDYWILLSLVLTVIAIFYILKSLYFICKSIARIYPFVGSILFFGIIYSLRKMMLYFKLPSVFYSLKLFNPSLYSSDITPSLGDLFLFIISSQIIIVFFKRNFSFNIDRLNQYHLGFIFHTIALIFLSGESFSVNKIFERLVVESSIWFNFNYFPRLSIYSFVGLTIMLMTFSNYYLLSNFVIKNIINLKLNRLKILASFSILFLVLIYFTFFLSLKFETKVTFYLLFIFLIFSYVKYYLNYKSRLFSTLLFLFFATSITSFLLYYNNQKKEQLILSSIASNVVFGRDKALEKKIVDKLLCFRTNQSHFCIDSLNEINVRFQRIDNLEYQSIFSQIADNLLTNHNLVIYSDQNLKLILVNYENDKKYISEIALPNERIYFSIYPQNYLNNIANSTKKAINDIIIRDNNINYALYINDSLVESSGIFPYNAHYTFSSTGSKMIEKALNTTFEHNLFPYQNNIKILVTTQEAETVSILTQFSYIFCFNLILFLIFQAFAYGLNLNSNQPDLFNVNNLRSKIVISIFLIIVSIFLSITYLSYNSLKTKFLDYNRDVLLNNLQITQASINSILSSTNSNYIQTISDYIDQLSMNNNIQVKLYDGSGILIHQTIKDASSEVAEVMNPIQYWKMRNNNSKILEIKNENSIYDQYEAISSLTSKNLAEKYYISLTTNIDKNNRGDATKLIVVLLNLYVILFLISMAFAFWIANNITKPLKQLADRISKIQFSKQNEYLEYKYKDEIGELVKRYNTMVDEIEESAKLLAYHEREEAWSEMAKQIAHEIKNPLTPMKLKIQYLQRKIKDDADDLKEFTLDVTNTLIEQINNLDNIASSFSSFAKLHNAVIEEHDWLSLVRNVALMFESSQVSISFKTHLHRAYINCDQNQMVSCLNNLIKNAIQSFDADKSKLEISLDENRVNYILKIRDYGKGISAENRDKIFTPNFTTKSSGTGLGLAITKKIIESISGKIYFESELGKGTTFYISIPKAKVADTLNLSKIEKIWVEMGFVPLDVENIQVKLAYTTSDNVFSSELYHDFERAFLHKMSYTKLLKAAEYLSEQHPNYQLVVLDALRPFSIQQKMWESYEGENKAQYIALPDKDSMHNYGMAVDVMILQTYDTDFDENKLLDFGCEFDDFSEKAHFDFKALTSEQISNRNLLKSTMIRAGFISYEYEFWHYEAMDKNWVRENCERV